MSHCLAPRGTVRQRINATALASVVIILITSVMAQRNSVVLLSAGYGQATEQITKPTAEPAVPEALSSVRYTPAVQVEHNVLPSSEISQPCSAVWITSSDPWIRSVEVASQLLSFPEFVNSGIAVSSDEEHADLVIQLTSDADADGSKTHSILASRAQAKLWHLEPYIWPEADYRQFIARKVLRLILAECVVPRDSTGQESPLPPETVKKRLSDARVMKPIVKTSFMRDKVLFAALAARPEFSDWGIKTAGVNDHPDIDLVVGHVFSTLTWTFKLVDHGSGSLLDSGTVVAFTDDRAATRIAAATVKQIAARRLLHHPNRLVAVASAATHKGVDQGPAGTETWVVKAVSEDMSKRYPGNMRLFIQDGNLMASDLNGRVLFSIPGGSILDFADTKSYHTLGDNIRADDDNWNGCDEGCAFGLLVYIPALVVLDRFRINEHIFEIAWTENATIRVASLLVAKGDYEDLFWTLRFLMRE